MAKKITEKQTLGNRYTKEIKVRISSLEKAKDKKLDSIEQIDLKEGAFKSLVAEFLETQLHLSIVGEPCQVNH